MIGVAILFIILGALVKYGKMYFLISGYNTLSPAEKEKVNVEAIADVFRNGMFGMALVIIAGYLISMFTGEQLIYRASFFVAILLGLPYLIVVSNIKKKKS
jgi:hypothetical protein